MARYRELFYPGVALAALVLATLACTVLGGAGQPSVSILSPAPNSNVPLNEPLLVEVSASDTGGPGVVEIELQMDGATVDTFEVGVARESVTTMLTCTPATQGQTTLTALAYRDNGTASEPATLALTVGPTDASAGPASGEEPPSTEEAVQAQVNLDTNVRVQPGPTCQIIGQVPQGATIDLLQRTTSTTEYWYQTDYLGPANLGWVYHEPLTIVDDDSALPRVPEQSCAGCGDGTCSPDLGEDCYTCAPDCGQCCGNGLCEDQLGETCETCAGDCGPCLSCGDGACSAEVGEDCETCEADCGACPYCGDNVVDAGEECDPPGSDCGAGYICVECVCAGAAFVCGDGNCAGSPHEDADSCPDDCIFGDAGGSDADFTCGDDVCAGFPFEDSDSCPEDCIFGDAGGSE